MAAMHGSQPPVDTVAWPKNLRRRSTGGVAAAVGPAATQVRPLTARLCLGHADLSDKPAVPIAGSGPFSPPQRSTSAFDRRRRKSVGDSSSQAGGEGVPVQVLVRCRPLLSKDAEKANAVLIEASVEGPEKVVLRVDPRTADIDPISRSRVTEPRNFRCNAYCGESASQEDLFAHAAPVVDRVMEGYNGTIFCYGITGSGKTYTMSGPLQEKKSREAVAPEQHGVVQRSATRIFEFIRDHSGHGEMFSVEASFLEIYSSDGVRETLVDLLADVKGNEEHKLEMRQDPTNKEAFYCEGLKSVPIRSPDDVIEVLSIGRRRCTFMETTRNCLSSRSHCIFVLTVEGASELESGKVRRGKLVLVDLAGSESLKKVTAASEANEELRRRQAIGINRVLSNLGAVVNNLNTGFQNNVGYRNSALTMLLRDCLGGHARALLIANISPEAEWCSETFTTLTFGQQMMQVRNVERVTVIESSQSTLMQMRQRHLECVKRLQGELGVVEEEGEESEEWQRLQKEVEELNKRLLTRTSATETLAQMQQEQTRKIEELREEVTQAMAREIASIQEQTEKDWAGLREILEVKAREGGAQAEQQQREAFEAQIALIQKDINTAEEARQAAEGDIAKLQVQLAAAEQMVSLLQELQQDAARERSDLEAERREMRQQAEEQGRKVTDLEGEKERYRAEAGVLREELERLRVVAAADAAAALEDRLFWSSRKEELEKQAEDVRSQCETQDTQRLQSRGEVETSHQQLRAVLRVQLQQLEADGAAQSAELQLLQDQQAALEEELIIRRQQEDEFRRDVEDEIASYDDEIEQAKMREGELMVMLTEVQSSIMHSTRPKRNSVRGGRP